MSALTFKYERGGIYLPALRLWLDPREPQTGADKVFISHAHSDHIGEHREVVLSAPTARFLQARLGGARQEHILPFGLATPFDSEGVQWTITLLPAGHVRGSAMSLLEAEGDSLLYTGDFKLRRGLSAESCEPRHADALIMETTYGRAQYRFPPTGEVLQGVIRFCREAIDNDETPVLLGYSLGKSQELLCGLAEAGLPILLHESVFKLTQIYEQLGQKFPAYEKFAGKLAAGKALLWPPMPNLSAALRKLGRVRAAVLTGWAVDPNCRFRYQADAAFPLSDHADFPDLVEFVKRVAPKKAFTLHGFAADFAQTLREMGFDARALSEEEQLALPLSGETLRFAGQGFAAEPRAAPGGTGVPPSVPPVRIAATAHGQDALATTALAPASGEPIPDPSRPPWRRSGAVARREGGEETLASGPSGATGAGADPSKRPLEFMRFAETCGAIGAVRGKLEKVRRLADYLQTLEGEPLTWVTAWFAGYPFPPGQNKVLQLGGALLSEALCAVGRINRAELRQIYLKHSDGGETAFEVLSIPPSTAPELSLEDVRRLFEQLHAARGPTEKLPLFTAGLRRCAPLEGKYLVKIVTGDLRIGLKEGLLEEALAKAFSASLDDVKRANLLLGDVGETARLAQQQRLASASLVPFRPVKFMLASAEETAAGIWERMRSRSGDRRDTGPTLWLEDKYDGVRCQLHKAGERAALYSRDLKEITDTFFDIADAARSLPGQLILDGEILAMRGEQVLAFADLQKRLGRRQGDLFLGGEIPVRFLAFDLLWRDGRSLLDEPLRVRRRSLESLAPLPDAFGLARVTRAESPEEIETAFRESRARGNEGLMIKDPESVYSPGRRGLAWLKLKKALATLDCVVVGAEYGHGKRKDVLSDYTFAVRESGTGQLKTIGKAYTGLTDAEIAELTRHFLGKTLRQHGRYHEVEPDTVLEIAFDSIHLSDRHSSGLAMRFPRIVRIRTDKSLADIDTVAAARRLVKERGSKTVHSAG